MERNDSLIMNDHYSRVRFNPVEAFLDLRTRNMQFIAGVNKIQIFFKPLINFKWGNNSLNAELNPICHLLALLGAHHILHVSRIRFKHFIIQLMHNI